MDVYRETLHQGFEQVLHLAGPPLVDERTAHQHIQVFDTVCNGRVLVLDGILQITDRDEASYSEMLAHPPILEHGEVRRVLVVGGGDGAVAEEVLKQPRVEHVDLVEIDPRVVEVAREHLASVNHGVFDEPRLEVVHEDAFAFLECAASGSYDLVIADRPDPVGPAESLFSDAFYRRVREALAPRGIAVFQTGCPFYQAGELSETHALLRRLFDHAGVYLTVTPTYSGGFMALTWGARGLRLGESTDVETLTRRYHAAGLATDYYAPEVHKAAFALPPWIARLLG